MGEFLYGSSMTIIAFYALILSTPNISILKKAGTLLIGTGAFFLTDLFFVQYIIFPQGQPVSNEDSPAFEIYLCIKWLLPFLLWIIASYRHLGEFLASRTEERFVK
jgi:F0F1-type ATP synthase assembly protein I